IVARFVYLSVFLKIWRFFPLKTTLRVQKMRRANIVNMSARRESSGSLNAPQLHPDFRETIQYNACSPRTNEVLRREMPRVLAGFATFWQFFARVYTHLHAGQSVWQTDI